MHPRNNADESRETDPYDTPWSQNHELMELWEAVELVRIRCHFGTGTHKRSDAQQTWGQVFQ